MRLFIAIQLNDDMREALLDMQDRMREIGVQGNYTRPENLHLTAAFIGEYPAPEEVLEALETVRFRPFELAFGETGAFDRLWWAGLAENPQLFAVVRKVRRALADAGIPFDRKKFRPHITLIRNASGRRDLTVADVIQSAPAAAMTVNHISLMRSDRGRQGMIYTELGRIVAE
ncbi:MAG: RNA 2',3'-cyclic phosphodiesterase [Mogibacterium sp.]|nr:RNA 2',3'-cyclic phosphodiesterase [Mogibacterium sp.]